LFGEDQERNVLWGCKSCAVVAPQKLKSASDNAMKSLAFLIVGSQNAIYRVLEPKLLPLCEVFCPKYLAPPIFSQISGAYEQG